MSPCARARQRAFTLVEVVLTILVVGVGLVASMRALPVILNVSQAARDSLVAQRLATDLLAEMSMLPFEDPDGDLKFGVEPDEAPSCRGDFDDIDDYDGWTGSPPQKKDGRTEPDCDRYTRKVLVQSVEYEDFNKICGDDKNKPKRITITVSKPGAPDVVLISIRLRGANREDLQ